MPVKMKHIWVILVVIQSASTLQSDTELRKYLKNTNYNYLDCPELGSITDVHVQLGIFMIREVDTKSQTFQLTGKYNNAKLNFAIGLEHLTPSS